MLPELITVNIRWTMLIIGFMIAFFMIGIGHVTNKSNYNTKDLLVDIVLSFMSIGFLSLVMLTYGGISEPKFIDEHLSTDLEIDNKTNGMVPNEYRVSLKAGYDKNTTLMDSVTDIYLGNINASVFDTKITKLTSAGKAYNKLYKKAETIAHKHGQKMADTEYTTYGYNKDGQAYKIAMNVKIKGKQYKLTKEFTPEQPVINIYE